MIWKLGEVSALEATEELSKRRDVARNTVRTTMERLEEKGWITHRVIGRTFVYKATINKEASIGKRIVDVIDGVCGGKPDNLVNALLQYRGLSSAEISRIEKLLDEAKSQGRKK